MKLTSSGLCLALCLCVGPARAATSADQAIHGVADKLLALIASHHDEYVNSPSKFYAMVDTVVVPYFDLDRVGRLTLGPHWRSASAAQRRRLTATFKNSLIHSYADAILNNKDSTTVEWATDDVLTAAADRTVKATLISASNRPVPLVFSVGNSKGQWKIYDVSVDGVSLAAGLRSQFNSEIAKNGLNGLINRLESKGDSG